MFISQACLWLLLAAPAWSQSNVDRSQLRINIPGWDISDLYSRITNAFSAPHKKQKVRRQKVDPAAIDDYYNNYWENYYYHNPPYVEYVPWPRPPPRPRPRPTRRPRPTTTTTSPLTTSTAAATTTTASTTILTTTPATATSTTTPRPSTSAPTKLPPTSTSPPSSTPPPISTPRPTSIITTNQPIREYIVSNFADDYSAPEAELKPEQQLSIKSRPQSVTSLCHYHPKLCDQPDEAHFMELTDGNGNPLILIAPATTTRRPFRQTLRPTRGDNSQRKYSRGKNKIYMITPKAKRKASSINLVPRSRYHK
ncbi:mucin-2-like [Drosophila novamexicana]|uniref:mucin-2-like n=1 Tax=Drosophila novamexicana TaxID=47314 RepID=UPI0011E5F8F8|nr:mucin-2-like [Drosophila novamexicana]